MQLMQEDDVKDDHKVVQVLYVFHIDSKQWQPLAYTG